MIDFLIMLLEFFKTGLFAVGGGLATIPFLQEMAEKYPHWFTAEELTDMIAVGESTPGPIGINMATYAGYRAAGIPGAIGVTLALALPSFIIICIISKILTKFASNKYVNGAFTGMRPAVPALILAAVIPLFVVSVSNTGAFDLSSISAFFTSIDYIALAVFGAVLIGFSVFKKWHPLIFIAFGAVVGIIFKL